MFHDLHKKARVQKREMQTWCLYMGIQTPQIYIPDGIDPIIYQRDSKAVFSP